MLKAQQCFLSFVNFLQNLKLVKVQSPVRLCGIEGRCFKIQSGGFHVRVKAGTSLRTVNNGFVLGTQTLM